MSTDLLALLEHSPCVFIVAVILTAMGVLWRTIIKKDTKIYDLSEVIIKVAGIYEKNINKVEIQNKEHNEQHAAIIELLKDIKRIMR